MTDPLEYLGVGVEVGLLFLKMEIHVSLEMKFDRVSPDRQVGNSFEIPFWSFGHFGHFGRFRGFEDVP
jgi:hypothetical protein